MQKMHFFARRKSLSLAKCKKKAFCLSSDSYCRAFSSFRRLCLQHNMDYVAGCAGDVKGIDLENTAAKKQKQSIKKERGNKNGRFKFSDLSQVQKRLFESNRRKNRRIQRRESAVGCCNCRPDRLGCRCTGQKESAIPMSDLRLYCGGVTHAKKRT